MNIYKSFDDIEFNRYTVLTVGTFDGVHIGHQLIINQLNQIASNNNLRAVLLTIHPHPQIVLQKEGKSPVKLLTTIGERLKLFEDFGIPNTLIIPFTKEFSLTPPESFVTDFLMNKIGFSKILIGYDHMFGKNREGGENLLRELSNSLNFQIEKMPPIQNQNIIVSSTKIRKSIEEKNISLANSMLGYFYLVEGIVTQGDGRGKTLGIPTANIISTDLNKLIPANGVYLVSSDINGSTYYGMANIGYRPTFTNDINSTIEIHFFNFNQNLYGEKIIVHFIEFIREEQKFSSKEEFLNQLNNDKNYCLERIKNFIIT